MTSGLPLHATTEVFQRCDLRSAISNLQSAICDPRSAIRELECLSEFLRPKNAAAARQATQTILKAL